jgi:3-oxoacyl-[acyl-carrier-protein] synthase-3
MKSIILGTGRYLPSNVVTNHDLAQRMDTNHEWIVERTGIHERRFAIPGVDTTASMGTEAAKRALDAAGLGPQDVDLILFATLSPDYYFPGPGVQLQHNLGCRTIGAIDIRNQCSGFVYALSIADQYLRNGAANHVLVVGSELHSGGLDMSTRGRNVSVIFVQGPLYLVAPTNPEEACCRPIFTAKANTPRNWPCWDPALAIGFRRLSNGTTPMMYPISRE